MQGLVVLRKGPVPNDLDSLGYNYDDVQALINDPNLISISSASQIYPTTVNGTIAFNTTELVPSDFPAYALRNKWFLPAKISTEVELVSSPLMGKELYGDVSLAMQRLCRHCIYMPTEYSNVKLSIVKGEYLSENTPNTITLSGVQEVSTISIGGYYYSAGVYTSNLPNRIDLEYLNPEDEWVTLMDNDRIDIQYNRAGVFSHKITTLMNRYSSGRYYRFNIHTIDLTNNISMKAIRLKPSSGATNKNLCSVGYINLHSDTKPEGVNEIEVPTHAIVHPADKDERLSLKPFIQDIENLEYSLIDYVPHRDIPNIDHTLYGLKWRQS